MTSSVPVPRRPVRVAGVMLYVMIAAFLGFFTWTGGRMAWRDYVCRTTFRPISAEVRRTSIIPRQMSRGGPAYVPRVVYRYVIGDAAYTSTRVTPLDLGGSAKWAREVADNYQAGQTVTAYYDPAAPNQAYLSRDRIMVPYLLAGIPAVLLALLLRSGIGYFRMRRRNSSPSD